MFFLFIIVSLLVSLVIQHFLGAVPPWGARVLLTPIVFFYGALSFPTSGMLVLAFISGVSWDLLHGVWVEESLELGVGWSVCAYAVFGAIVSGLRPLFLRGRWEVHCLFSGLAVACLVLIEYALICLRREPLVFEFSPVVWGRVFGAGVIALVVSPVVFSVLGYVARLMRHRHHRSKWRDFDDE